MPNFTLSQAPVPELCQNPIHLVCRELLFERKQLPQIVDNRHFRMELMESLETANILRNQQVAGSIPAGGSRTHGQNVRRLRGLWLKQLGHFPPSNSFCRKQQKEGKSIFVASGTHNPKRENRAAGPDMKMRKRSRPTSSRGAMPGSSDTRHPGFATSTTPTNMRDSWSRLITPSRVFRSRQGLRCRVYLLASSRSDVPAPIGSGEW